MTYNFTRPKYLLHWDYSCAKNCDQDVVVARHRLAELSLSQDQQLIELLDQHPTQHMQVFSMGHDLAHPSELQIGELVDCSGEQLLSDIRSGRLIVSLSDVAQHHDHLRRIVSRLYSELAECATGFRWANLTDELVLASPGAMQYFHCDHRPTVRWQLRGSQSISVYPTTDQLVDPICLQSTVLDSTANSLYYEPEFAYDAQTYFFESGQMISLPYLTPYHVDYHDDLCVWLQTQHDTPASLRQKNIVATNRLLNRIMPRAGQNNSTRGAIATAKHLLGELLGLAQRVAHPASAPEPTFRITRKIAQRSSPISAQISDPSADTDNRSPIAGFLSSPTSTTTTTPVISEN
ncbi:MAG: hypothetical protein WBD20_13360 [Pirellulaceae bacterium]